MSPLSSPVQAVVAIYSGPLHGVRFADIDADILGTLATEVESIGGEVESLEAQLAGLREALAQKEEALQGLAQQALAYARIYAESDEALSAELNEIVLPRATKPRKAGATKSSSERAARAPKEPAESSAEPAVAEVELEVEVEAAEPPVVIKPKRKAAAEEASPKQEAAAPAKAGRRKVPTRSGRAR